MSHRIVFSHGDRKKQESDRLIVYTEAFHGNGMVILKIPLKNYLVSSLVEGIGKSQGSSSMKAPMTGNVEKVSLINKFETDLFKLNYTWLPKSWNLII